MADTDGVQDVNAVAQMLDDDRETKTDGELLQSMAIAINQAIDAITPKITVHHGNDN